jgi:hypothetical protein
VNDRVVIEVVNGGHDAILEFLFGCDADVAQDGASEFGKETLDEVEPGAVLGSESEFEAVARVDRQARLWSLWRCEQNDCRGSA